MRKTSKHKERVDADHYCGYWERGRVVEIRINLNEKVQFKLSERGEEVYRHRYDGLEPELDDDGYMSMQLWTFMEIFGKHMTLGMPEVVEPLEIIYKQEDESDTISRQAVEEMIKAEMPERGMWEIEGDKVKETVCEVCVDLMQKLSELPPTEPKRPKGEWIVGTTKDFLFPDQYTNVYQCDQCGATEWRDTNYCPSCGAKMGGDSE